MDISEAVETYHQMVLSGEVWNDDYKENLIKNNPSLNEVYEWMMEPRRKQIDGGLTDQSRIIDMLLKF